MSKRGGYMRRTLLLLTLIVLLGLVVSAPVVAADTATIDLTMANAVVSITIDQTAWDALPQPLGANVGSPPFIVTNNGNIKADLWVVGTDATMTGGTGTWSLLDTNGSPGLDQFRLDASPYDELGGPQITPTLWQLRDNSLGLNPSGTYRFSLNLMMPASVTQRGTYSSQVIITATEHAG